MIDSGNDGGNSEEILKAARSRKLDIPSQGDIDGHGSSGRLDSLLRKQLSIFIRINHRIKRILN